MHEKKKDRIAIVGMSPLTRDQAPFRDKSFEIWALNEMYQYIPRFDVLFEIHDRWWFQSTKRDPQHYQWLKENKRTPIYMSGEFKEIPMAILYPYDEIIARFGTYITNTATLMLLLAYYMEYKEIHIYGIDMNTSEEYGLQKASFEHYLGYGYAMFHYRGWPVIYLPPESELLKTPIVYGKEGIERWQYIIMNAKKEYQRELFRTENEMWKFRDLCNYNKGAKEALERIQKMEYKK